LRPAYFAPDSADAFDGQCGGAGLFGDEPVLILDRGAGGVIAVEAAEEFTWDSAIRPPRAVLIEDIE
jgi:hypothetical protein